MSRRTLVIGVDGGAPAGDAIALGAVLAPALDADPTLVYAHPYGALEDVVGSGEYATLVRELADDAARQVQAHFGLANAARLRVLPNPSPAAALQAVARQERAAGVVIGSSHRGAIGRMLPGAVTRRLLAGAPCPVAVAPAGYADRPPDALGRIAVGFDGSDSAWQALRVASQLAPATDSALDVIAVHRPIAFGHLVGAATHNASVNRRLKADLEDAVRHVADQAGDADELTVELREGDPVSELVTASRDSGLLVVGSRGYGPLGAVLLGSVSTRVVEHAACPVMVVPRTAPTPQPPPADAADLWANRRARHPL